MNRRNFFYYAIGSVLSALLGLITVPLIAWVFSTEDVGRLAMLQIALGLSTSVFSIQMHQAYVREYHEVSNKRILFKSAFLPGFCLCLVYFFVSFIWYSEITKILFDIESIYIIILLNISIVFLYFINFYLHVIRMQGSGFAFSLGQVLPKISFIFFIGLLVLLEQSAKFSNLIALNAFSLLITLLFLSFVTKNTWIDFFSEKFDLVLSRKMLKFSLPLVVGGLFYWGLTTVDRLFLRYFSGLEDLGIYTMATTISSAVIVVSTVFSNIWHPVAYRWISNKENMKKFDLVTKAVIIMVAFIWSFFGVFAWVPLLFLPEEYSGIESLIIICVSAPLLYMLSEATMIGIGATRKSSYSMLASLMALITSVILNFLFVPMFGAKAAAISTMFAFLVFFVCKTEASNRLWIPQPRRGMYFFVIAYTLIALLNSSVDFYLHDYLFKLIWIFMFLTLLVYNKSDALEILNKGKNFISKG